VDRTLDDHRLVDAAASRIGVPRASVDANRSSFVLHAPLELLARAALLPHVAPRARDEARERIVTLVEDFEVAGPPVPSPRGAHFESLEEAAATLASAVTAGELDDVDATAAWLGARTRPDQLVALLGDDFVDRLGAAGHANIYLALLARTQPRGLADQMLRHPARQLAQDRATRIRVPPLGDAATAHEDRVDEVLAMLSEVEPVGPPPSYFIAPLVEFAQDAGVLDRLRSRDGSFAAPAGVPFGMLRFAAHAMLQGPAEQAPYGWTHCLTLAQAPLLIAPALRDPKRAVFVATAYLAAHWAGEGAGTIDLSYEPPAADDDDVAAAVGEGPARAAGAAWHATDRAAVVATLATSASRAEDAHRVKYTLACIDAATADPRFAPLYLAAAAYLAAWWEAALAAPVS
jgi:hypothetical protein